MSLTCSFHPLARFLLPRTHLRNHSATVITVLILEETLYLLHCSLLPDDNRDRVAEELQGPGPPQKSTSTTSLEDACALDPPQLSTDGHHALIGDLKALPCAFSMEMDNPLSSRRAFKQSRRKQRTVVPSALLTFLISTIPIVSAQACVALSGSTQCPAFNTSSVSTSSNLTSLLYDAQPLEHWCQLSNTLQSLSGVCFEYTRIRRTPQSICFL